MKRSRELRSHAAHVAWGIVRAFAWMETRHSRSSNPTGVAAASHTMRLWSGGVGLALAFAMGYPSLFAVHGAQAQESEAAEQGTQTDRYEREVTEANACQDPFCTYGPPRLNGDDMAAAARDIIAAANTVSYGFLPEDRPAEEAFVNAFLLDEHFDFLSPYYIAEHKDDPRLANILGATCIAELTEVPNENGPTSTFSGPLYIYKIRPLLAPSTEYEGVFLFGGATVGQVKGMTFEERVSRAQSTGYFYLLGPAESCEVVYALPIDGRGEREFVTKFTPRLDGVGYHKGSVIVYTLLGINPAGYPKQTYSFRWIELRPQTDGTWSAESYGSALLSDFPDDFDPFSNVESKKGLR